jgi:drug/metabolite transporter (DMT)-like permease
MPDRTHLAQPSRWLSALLLLVMMAWGLNIPAVKALTGVMDVVWVGAIRLLAASVVITLCLLLRDRRLPRLPARDWGVLACISALTIYANQLLFVQGMRMASASNASLVMALMPLLALLAGALLLRERIRARTLAGVVLGFAGVAVVVLRGRRAAVGIPGAGEAVIVAGLVTFIVGGLMIQRAVRRLDVLVVGWAIYVCGTCMLCLHAALSGGWRDALGAFDAGWVWWAALYSGVVGTALSNVGWYYALGRVGQSRASPYLYWIAVFGVGFSALTLAEPLGWWHALGLAMVVAGVRMGAGPRPAR